MEAIGEDGSYDTTSARVPSEISEAGYTYFAQGDVVRARVTPCFENGKGAFLSELIGGRGLGTTELFVFTPSPEIDARFLYYITISKDFTDRGAATMYGAHGVRRVDERFVRDYRAWLPSLETQRIIADYLERETAEIDTIIAAKRRLAGLLAERPHAAREQLVEAATSAGKLIRLGRLLTVVDERLAQAPPPQLFSVSIHHGVIPYADANPDRQPRAEELHRYKKCRQGDIVLNRMRAFQGGIGLAPSDGIASPDYAVLRPAAGVSPPYLSHLMRSPWFVGKMERILRGIGGVEQGNVRTPRVNWADLRLVEVPAPPLDRQESLVASLVSSLEHCRQGEERLATQIELLQERRQALITAAVAGQLDIPEAA